MKTLVAAAGVALVLVASSGAALIVGSSRSDLLLGTTKRDRIAAFGGNDRIDVAGGRLDRVSCGRGTDLVAADATDRLSGCEVVSRRISRDPYRGGGAQHATQAEPDSFSWGTKVVAAFQVARLRRRRRPGHRLRGFLELGPHVAQRHPPRPDGRHTTSRGVAPRERPDRWPTTPFTVPG